jgi:uncharacterized protein (DUF1501 family)
MAGALLTPARWAACVGLNVASSERTSVVTAVQNALPSTLQRLRLATALLEDAETERDAAIAAALTNGQPAAEVAEMAGLSLSAVQRIATTWEAPTGGPQLPHRAAGAVA